MDDQECNQQSAGLNLEDAAAEVFCKNMQSALKDCTWGYVDNQGASYQNAREICRDEASRYMPVGNWLTNSFNNTIERFSDTKPGVEPDDEQFNQSAVKMPIWQISLIAVGAVVAVGGAVWGLVSLLKKGDKKSKSPAKNNQARNLSKSNKVSGVLHVTKQCEPMQLTPNVNAVSHLTPVRVTINDILPATESSKQKALNREKTTYNNTAQKTKKRRHKKTVLPENRPQSNSIERI